MRGRCNPRHDEHGSRLRTAGIGGKKLTMASLTNEMLEMVPSTLVTRRGQQGSSNHERSHAQLRHWKASVAVAQVKPGVRRAGGQHDCAASQRLVEAGCSPVSPRDKWWVMEDSRSAGRELTNVEQHHLRTSPARVIKERGRHDVVCLFVEYRAVSSGEAKIF